MGRKFKLQILRRIYKKFIAIMLTLSIVLLLAELSPIMPIAAVYPASVTYAAEAASIVYYGDTAAAAILSSLNYTDVSKTVWSRDAIYETGALGIIKGENAASRRFGRTVPLTKEEAIAIAYRAAGRESEARQLGVEINNARAGANKKTDPIEVWYDGYLQLAANEGLISAQDLADAFSVDQGSLSEDRFRRKSSAQRQEFAYWLARTLNIEPASRHHELPNYSDWKSIDPEKTQYLEAMLQERIITGSGGRINPRQSVTREQAAQIVKNAEHRVLEALGYFKYAGTIGDISVAKDYTQGKDSLVRNVPIVNADGSRTSILTSEPASTASGNRNESSGTPVTGPAAEIVVNRDGTLGNSSLLKKGDRIYYITDSNNIVKYVDVISNVKDVKYIAVEINEIDRINYLLSAAQLFEMNYPSVDSISGNQSISWSGNEMAVYRISPDALVLVDGIKSDLSSVTEDATAILSVDSNNLVREIRCVDLGINTEARKIVRGIVEENNPDLGYLTLFNEDGSGTGNSAVLRTYNYVNQNKTEVYRNHMPATVDSIQAGDTVYIKLDDEGDIASISAVDNYSTRYGRVISKMPSEILVEYDDGTQQLLTVPKNIIVIKERQLVGLNSLQDGDRVRLLVNETGKTTDLKEITIEGVEHYISNIYKGTVTRIDRMSEKITVMGLQVFNKGEWERTEQKAVTAIPLAENIKIYSGGTLLDIDTANRLLYANEAYIAVEKTYGGEEQALVLSFRNSLDTPVPTSSDTITGTAPGSGRFTLVRENKRVNYSDGSIVVKYGRLTTGNSLNDNDKAYLALDRDYSTGDYFASVVKVDEPQAASGLVIYRGRIKEINEGKNFTVESFSELQGTDWRYSNTPKTFNITFDTRMLNDDGVLNVRDFKGYGDESYLQRTVYVVADGPNAVLVSTAPHGTKHIRGTVYSVEDNEILLYKASIYDEATHMWKTVSDARINLLNNTVIIHNGKVGSADSIRKGSIIRVIKKDANTEGDGYIIFVE